MSGSTPKYNNLSIRIKADGFSFSVSEGANVIAESGLIKAENTQALAETLSRSLHSEEIQQYRYGRVRAIVDANSTTVPMKEFASEDSEFLYSLVFPPLKEGNEICHAPLPHFDLVELFDINSSLKQTIISIFPEATFTCASAVLVGRAITYSIRQKIERQALFAYTTPLRLYLYSVSSDGQLKFSCSYSLESPQDSLYMLISVWKALKLDVRRNHCFVAGEKDSVDYLSNEAKRFLQHVNVESFSIEIN